jgi:hypothetical protein
VGAGGGAGTGAVATAVSDVSTGGMRRKTLTRSCRHNRWCSIQCLTVQWVLHVHVLIVPRMGPIRYFYQLCGAPLSAKDLSCK